MDNFTNSGIKRVIKGQGATRVNKQAISEFKEIIDDYSETVADKAIELANHAGRVTVFPSDVKLARKVIENL